MVQNGLKVLASPVKWRFVFFVFSKSTSANDLNLSKNKKILDLEEVGERFEEDETDEETEKTWNFFIRFII